MLRRVTPAFRCSLALTVCAVALVGCGEDDDYENRARPPVPRNVTAVLTESDVSVSPQSLQAGPITMIISNQSGTSQVATIEVDELGSNPGRERRAGLRQSTGPINPQDTATLQVVVQEFTTYTVKTDDDSIDPARLRVTREAPTSQNDVLLP